MDLHERQLRAFVTVCEEGSITRAAARLFVSQPTLSRQLSSLEREVGSPLVERLPRSVRPTAAGRSLLDSARAVLAAQRDFALAARRVETGVVGELRIGTLFSLSLGLLPTLLAGWRARHPLVQASLHEFRHREDLVAGLVEGAYDLAIGSMPEAWPGGSRLLGAEELVLVLDGAGGGGAPGPIDVASLRDREWVHFAPGNGLGEILDGTCARAGFAPRVALRTEQARAAIEYAVRGLGCTLVPSNVVPPGVPTHRLREPVLRDISAYWRGAGDPLTRSLVESSVADARGILDVVRSEPR